MENLTATIIGVVILGVFCYYCWVLLKKYPKEDLGQVLSYKAVVHNETLLIMLLIFAAIAEGITASTVFSNDPSIVHSNVLGRLTLHMVITLAGVICTLTLFRDFSAIFDQISGKIRLARILAMLLVFCVAVGAPLANLVLLAGNLKQESVVSLYAYSWICSNETWIAILSNWGYDAHWSPWAAMQPSLKANVVIGMFHVAIGLLESLRLMSTVKRQQRVFFQDPEDEKKEEGKEKEGDKKKEKPDNKYVPMEGEERAYNALSENAKFLLNRVGYRDGALENIVKEAVRVMDAMHKKNEALSMGMAARMGNLVTRAKTVDSSNDADKSAKKEALKKDIFAFFQSKTKNDKGDYITPADKCGLGMSLKGGPK